MSLMRQDHNPIGHQGRHDHLAPVSVKTLEKIGYFKKTANLVLYKKSERICAATFVVSDGIGSETLRERARSEALGIFSGVRDAISRRGSVVPAEADSLALSAASLVSILELACRIGEVTEANYTILRQECLRLAELLIETATSGADPLDRRIFDTGLRLSDAPAQSQVPAVPAAPRAPRRVEEPKVSYKGHQKDIPEAKDAAVSFKGSARDLIASLGSSIEDRESKIIDVVRSKVRVSIKDITDAMPGVGEKTIQRALVSLVTRGVLKKEGERRWSRYALAQATLAV